KEVELMANAALPFAARAQCAFLGWPENLHAPLIRWSRRNQQATLAQDREALSALALELEVIVAELIHARRRSGAAPHTDLTAALMHERVEGRALSQAELTSILRNWTVGEIGTISAAIGILTH